MLQVREYLLSDVVVVGAGIAGCKAAVEACEYGASVILVDQASVIDKIKRNKRDPFYATSDSAQYPENNWEQHAKDTFKFGESIGDISLISLLCKEALRNSWELDRYGYKWARNEAGFELSKLENHSFPRGLRTVADSENNILQQLYKEVNKHVGIKRLENCFVTTILMEEKNAVGVVGLDLYSGDLLVLTSGGIVLACGGMAGLFSFEGSRGSIIGQAYKLGAELISPEMQHVLTSNDGAIKTVQSLGGLRIDHNCQTNIMGLLAAGEAAGGIHGANILPGNGLTEAVVLGGIAGRSAALDRRPIPRIKEEGVKEEVIRLRKINKTLEKKSEPEISFSGAAAMLNSLMMNSYGSERSGEIMYKNLDLLYVFKEEWNQKIGIDQVKAAVQDLAAYIELESLIPLAQVVLKAGLMRQESRGVHRRNDFPDIELDWRMNIAAKLEVDQDVLSVVPAEKDFVL